LHRAENQIIIALQNMIEILIVSFFIVSSVIASGDPEANMKPPEIINHWGYPSETQQVTTSDGYVLNMHRIPYGKAGPSNCGPRPVVFLQHGLLATSSCWITSLPEKGLGYILADAGFDVWMGNVRGVEYSLGHTFLQPNSKEYWHFSWDEMVHYDLPAMVNKALNVSGQSSLYYVGHSQGTLIMFSKLADDQTFARKIRKYFALAPVATVAHIRGALSFLAHYFHLEFDLLYHLVGDDLSGLTEDNFVYEMIKHLFCGSHGDALCANSLGMFMGPESNQLNETRLPVYLSDLPGGTAMRNLIHWMQMVLSGNQCMYDYENHQQNMDHYGQSTPPIYDIRHVNAPTYLYWGTEDWLGDPTDIREHILPNIAQEYLIENHMLQDFNHLDFLWGERAPAEIFHPIVDTITADLRAQKHKCFQ
jgi:lysosomal acid lipase/cholesteryl ester hydrolase